MFDKQIVIASYLALFIYLGPLFLYNAAHRPHEPNPLFFLHRQ